MVKRAQSAAGHFRRFPGYDYSRGGSIFITATLAERRPLFGRVVRDHVDLSPAGEILKSQIVRVARELNGLTIRSGVIMPDHLHLRLTFAPGLASAVRDIGSFVGRIKQYSHYEIKSAGLCGARLWQTGYHDHLCLSHFINEQVDQYIANNPLKYHLMHGGGCLRVEEPLVNARLPNDEWWCGVGNRALLTDTTRICAVQLSRRIRTADYPAVLARLEAALDKGIVFAGTFISPLERLFYERLVALGAPIIRAVPDSLVLIYRPKGDEPRLFDAGRLLLLSRQVASDDRSTTWHGINAALGVVARHKGDDLYVKPGEDGRARWLFNEAAAQDRKPVKGLRRVGDGRLA